MNQRIPNSNSIILTGKEWLVTIGIFLIISFGLYFGWYHWEKLSVETDYRSTCWEERMSDYWAFSQWSRIACDKFKILLIGDSVVWGQEVSNTETISHYINQELGNEEVANLGIDGLNNAAMIGMFSYYARYIHKKKIILVFNPLRMTNPSRDNRGKGKDLLRFYHPRLVPQFDRRISYYINLNERLGYLAENYLRLPSFVRHLIVNYFENKSLAVWLMDHPYQLPFSAITFQGAPMMKKKQGLGIAWSNRKGARKSNDPFMSLNESIQWEYFLKAIKLLKNKGNNVFVLLGPYNTYCMTDESRKRFFAMMDTVKKKLDELGYPYFDSTNDLLPSEEYADNCHALKGGHIILAQALTGDVKFRQWLGSLK